MNPGAHHSFDNAEHRADRPRRPGQVFDPMLQHERTALAWERTAIAMMVVGVLFARHAATTTTVLSAFGVGQVVLGGLLLIWAGKHYDELHAPLRAGASPVHPGAARVVGVTTIAFTAAALAISIVAVFV